MNAIILAAGKGERMLPWTENKNKVMFKVEGIPLLEHHINNLKRIGIKNIYIPTFWKAEEIEAKYANIPEVIFYRMESLERGSGGVCIDIFKKYNIDRAIIINGDTYYDEQFYDKIPYLYSLDEVNFVFVQNISKDNMSGLLTFNKGTHEISGIYEKFKIDIEQTDLLSKNIGIMILNKIHFIKTGVSKGDLMKDALPKFNDLYAYSMQSKKWCDIGNIDRYINIVLNFYKGDHIKYLLQSNRNKFIEFIKKILLADKIFIAGNGGSMSTAQHLALDWSKVGKKNAIALDSTPTITAYANDEGYENIFINQLNCFKVNESDIILLISGSGNSKNIKKVIDTYPNNIILGMSGETGYLSDKIKLTLPVPSCNIRVIEDAHLCYGHAITEVMDGLN